MPLLDLKTDLKSLKYGSDQPGGGNSGQPYVTTDINKVDTGFNNFRMTKFDDGLIRGGTVGATNASVVDTIRIGKFLKDFPKGPLFITKQVGLQLSNPRLEAKSGISNFSSQPTRLYNLGVNTLAQVPVNAFGGHLNRHGLVPVQDAQTKYFYIALNNNDKNNNRLVKLKNKLIGTEDNIIDSYTGGPSSVYGIGRTLIRRRGDFIVVNQDVTESEWARVKAKEVGGYYRINGHGGELDGYDKAFRRIGNFIGVSLQTNSSFTPEQFSLISQLRDNLGDQISSINDTKEAKYLATVQETEASAKMRTPSAFVGASTKTSSSFVSSKFPDLTTSTYKLSTLNDNIASANDITSSKYNAIAQEAEASANMRTSLGFVGASTKTSSSFVSNRFPDLTDFGAVGEYKRTTLDDYIASANDVTSSKYNATAQEAEASAKMRTPSAFVGASIRSSSSFAPNTFPSLTSNNNKPQTLDDKTIRTYKKSSLLSLLTSGGTVQIDNDLGLSKLSKGITAADNGIPVDINDINTSLNQNAINYSNPTLKTYAELRNTINANSNISQETPRVGANFNTVDISINRGDPNFQYVVSALSKKELNRTNDTDVNDDSIALKFIPLDPFSGNALNRLNFLGYLTDYTENYDSNWGDVKYNGRAEKFYIFNEFKRTVNVGFQIPCFNSNELTSKHQDLSELASVLAGSYSGEGLLGGIITKLTVGNYINNQPGIITNLNFSPIQDSSWDLDIKLAYYLKVSFGFTLIHNYLPQYDENGFLNHIKSSNTSKRNNKNNQDNTKITATNIINNNNIALSNADNEITNQFNSLNPPVIPNTPQPQIPPSSAPAASSRSPKTAKPTKKVVTPAKKTEVPVSPIKPPSYNVLNPPPNQSITLPYFGENTGKVILGRKGNPIPTSNFGGFRGGSFGGGGAGGSF